MRLLFRGLFALQLGLSAAPLAHASNEAAALGAGLAQLFIAVVTGVTLVIALAAAVVRKLSYGRQLVVVLVFVAFATRGLALLSRWTLADIVLAFVVIGCVASLLHACIYHSVLAVRRGWHRMWRRGALQAVQGDGPASGGSRP